MRVRNVGALPNVEALVYGDHDERNRIEVAKMKILFAIISYKFSLFIYQREGSRKYTNFGSALDWLMLNMTKM